MTVAEVGSPFLAESLRRAVGPEGRVVDAPDAALPNGCCDRVLMADVWSKLGDPQSALDEAHRLLRHDGRLLIVEGHAGFDELVHTLEHHSWDVHRHGDAGPDCWFIEAGPSDTSVQS
jgi:SAM-dependent methyltransferase